MYFFSSFTFSSPSLCSSLSFFSAGPLFQPGNFWWRFYLSWVHLAWLEVFGDVRDAAAKHSTEHICTHVHTHTYRPRVYLGQMSTVPRLRSSLLDCALTSSRRTVKARLPDHTPEFLVPQVWVGHEACSCQGRQMLLAHTDEWEELTPEGNSQVFLPFPITLPKDMG